MRGRPTSAEDVIRFRKYFLKYGNATRAAKKVGIPASTGIDLAREAEKDESFVALRAELYTRAMSEVETLAADVARVSHRRFNKRWDDPQVEGVAARDPRPDYGRLVNDSLKAMSSHRSKIRPDDGEATNRVEVVIKRYDESMNAVADEPEEEREAPDPGYDE